VGELSGLDFEGGANVHKKLRRNQSGGRNGAGPLLLRIGPKRVRVKAHVVFEELGTQETVVSRVPKSIKVLVGVFDCQLHDSRIGDAGGMDRCIKVSAMARAVVRRKNKELRDAEARRELRNLDFRKRENIIFNDWSFSAVSLIHPVPIGGGVTDD
jgi:hypothetical protein